MFYLVFCLVETQLSDAGDDDPLLVFAVCSLPLFREC